MSNPPPPDDSWEYRLTIPHHAIGSGVARSTVRAILARHALPELADTAELLTSELCGNTYLHTTGSATVLARWADRTLHVGVQDGSDALPPCPTSLDSSPESEGGRGLFLVSRYAQAWGSRAAALPEDEGGKVTWFELRH
ncbi:hypothetical protein OK074_8003 [Actinobacteria bacterium OK074]|nr:hypothetical protein OK074_8003 [Actinobacteria bacterium OK074]